MNRNLVGSIKGRSSIKFAHFVLIRLQTWPPQAIIVSDWLNSKKSSLKPSSQINSNLVGSTYGRFCIKFPQNRMNGELTEPLVPAVSNTLLCQANKIQCPHLLLIYTCSTLPCLHAGIVSCCSL